MPDRTERSRIPGLLRNAAVLVLAGAMVYFARPGPLGVTVGFLIALLGEALRLWAAGHLRKTAELATSGPYRYTRNPLYLGRLIVFTGLCIMSRLPYHANYAVLILGYLVFFLYYLPRKERVEPARLRELHGEAYDRYHAAVSTLFPSATPYRPSGGHGWSSDRLIRNREHWMLAGLLLVTVYLLWRAYGGEP